MPELPEIQAHAERLDAAFRGAELAAFRPLTFSALKTFSPPPEAAIGHVLNNVTRRGKYLLLSFGDTTFIVHLMQGGRLKPEKTQPEKPRNGVARWSFNDGRSLLLTEAGTERKAGVWMCNGEPLSQLPLSKLGPEPGSLTAAVLHQRLTGNNMRLIGWLRDQSNLAGVGRRLCNEICWRAEMSPYSMTGKFTLDQATRLLDAINDRIGESLDVERTFDEIKPSLERPGAVYHRVGNECVRCGDTICAVTYSSYSVQYCPTCQTKGKPLADNTTSRFLK